MLNLIYLAASALALAAASPLLMIKRAPRQTPNRTRLPKSFQPTTPALTWTAAVSGGKARVTTATPWVYDASVPSSIVINKTTNTACTAITPVSSTVFDLTFGAHTVVATDTLIIPGGVYTVRNANGGNLAAGQTTF